MSTVMKCETCEHNLADHFPDSDEVGAHSCDVCECKGFIGGFTEGED